MTVDTDELVAWLREQLDEDEQAAREASWASPEWREDSSWLRDLQDPVSSQRARIPPGTELLSPAEAKHIARWDPARVLAEVEAKRRILDLHPAVPFDVPGSPDATMACDTCSGDPYYREGPGIVTWPCQTVLALVQPYGSGPGFKPEWRLT